MAQVQKRLLALLHYPQYQLSYRKRTEITVDMVR
jgi:hypothetical protein